LPQESAAAPKLVELVKEQYDEFKKIIEEISIDLSGESITIDVDLNKLETLQQNTIDTVASVGRANIDQLVILKDSNTAGTNGVRNDIYGFKESTSSGFKMLNNTLGWLYTLEKEEVAAINADFFRRLDNINEVLTTINGVSDTISGTLGVVNTFLSTTQNANLGAMINAQQRTNAILTELVDTFPAKILETVATTVFESNTAETVGGDFGGLFCGYDPIGIGPIDCGGYLLAEGVGTGHTITPVVRKANDKFNIENFRKSKAEEL